MNATFGIAGTAPNRLYLLANWPRELGGVQRVVQSLAAGLAARGFEVTVVGVAIGDRRHSGCSPGSVVDVYPEGAIVRRLQRWGRVVGLNCGLRFERIFLPGRVLAMRRLRRILEREPGHVIAMDVFAAEMLAAAGARSSEYRRLAQFHSSFGAIRGTRDVKRLRGAAVSLDRVLALTAQDAQEFAAAGFEAVGWVPNPLPFARRDLPLAGRANRVVSIGRLESHKGFELLIQAWAESKCRLSWELTILGDGPQREHLVGLIRELQVSDSVVVAGDSDSIEDELMDSQVLVLASEYEGLPMVLLEGMSQSVACLATDSSPGVRHLLQSGGAGHLTPVGDLGALVKSLDWILGDAEYRQGLASRGYRESERYELDRILDQWQLMILG